MAAVSNRKDPANKLVKERSEKVGPYISQNSIIYTTRQIIYSTYTKAMLANNERSGWIVRNDMLLELEIDERLEVGGDELINHKDTYHYHDEHEPQRHIGKP